MSEQTTKITKASVEALIARLDWGNSAFDDRQEVDKSLRFLLAEVKRLELAPGPSQSDSTLCKYCGGTRIAPRSEPPAPCPECCSNGAAP